MSRASLDGWQVKGLLTPHYTPGGHRRYLEEDLRRRLGVDETASVSSDNRAVIYARVSTRKQAEAGQLRRQEEGLVTYAVAKEYVIVARLHEVASGLNERRTALYKGRQLLGSGPANILLVEYGDRLARFGVSYLEYIVEQAGGRLEVLESAPASSPQEELVADLMAIVTSFSARLYGRRGGRVAQKVEQVLTQALTTDES